MKRTFLLTILAALPAVLIPLAAAGQVAPAVGKGSADRGERSYKWEAFAGLGYTSLNQVNLSRSGLMGANVSITRDWGKYFGVTADGAYYKYAVVSGNPGKPSVDAVLFGPVVHGELFGKLSGFARGLLGGEHSGGEGQTPNISFAGGIGGGMEYKLSPRLSLRASGDDIASSFSFINNSKALGYSPHKHWNSRAAFGVVFRF